MKKMFYASLMSVILGTQVIAGVNVFANTAAEATAEQNLEKNVIKLRGQDLQGHEYKGFDLVVDRATKTLKIENMKGGTYDIHKDFFSGEYIKIELQGANGKVKESVRLQGDDSTNLANKMNNVAFEYGDTLKIFHAEGTGHRFSVTGKVTNNEKAKEYTYVITKAGLVQQNPNKEVANSSFEFRGQALQNHAYKGFDLVVDIKNKTLEIERMLADGYDIHAGFGSAKYVEIELKGADGTVKEKVTLQGDDSTRKARDIDGKHFEYGDTLNIHFTEGHHRPVKVTGDVMDKNEAKVKDTSYIITQFGLIQQQ